MMKRLFLWTLVVCATLSVTIAPAAVPAGDEARGVEKAVVSGQVDDEDGDLEVIVRKLRDGEGGWLGVRLQDLTEQLGDFFGVEDGHGALVTEVEDGSPAAGAGLKAGDVIVEVGGERIEDSDDVAWAVRFRDPGDRVELRIVRKGKRRTVEVELAERPRRDRDRDVRVRRWRDGDELRFLPDRMLRRWHPLRPLMQEELENLRADIEELRARIEELEKQVGEK